MRPIHIRMTMAAAAACLGLASFGPVATASAEPGTQITSIAPASSPEFSSIPVTIHGFDFSTEPGGTSVSFGGTAATSVTCATSRRCTAMAPELSEGPVEVTATSNSMTSTATITFTYETYAPPVVKIIDDGGEPVFAQHKLLDRYPGIFDPGNVYLNIENTFPGPVTLTGPDGYTDLGEGLTAGFNMPGQIAPYLFAVEAGAKHQTLSVKARLPR